MVYLCTEEISIRTPFLQILSHLTHVYYYLNGFFFSPRTPYWIQWTRIDILLKLIYANNVTPLQFYGLKFLFVKGIFFNTLHGYSGFHKTWVFERVTPTFKHLKTYYLLKYIACSVRWRAKRDLRTSAREKEQAKPTESLRKFVKHVQACLLAPVVLCQNG